MNPMRFKLLESTEQQYQMDGLNSLEYTQETIRRLDLYMHIDVELEL